MIDVHSHLFSPGLLKVMLELFPSIADRIDERDGIVRNLMGKPLLMEDEEARSDLLLAAAGIETQIISLRTSVLIPRSDLSSDAARRIALSEATNHYLSQLSVRSDGRYRAFADAPLDGTDPDAATEAITKTLDGADLAGIALWSNYDGDYLDHPKYDALLWELNRRRTPLFLHPSDPPAIPAYEGFRLYSIVGFPAETSVCILRLIYSGVLDKYPDIPIITSHLGGFLPYIWWRLGVVGQRDREVFRPQMQEDPRTYLTRLYYDLALTDAESVRLAIRRVGVDRLVVGTDYPYGGGDDLGRTREMIDELGLDTQSSNLIYTGNAASIPGLLAKSDGTVKA